MILGMSMIFLLFVVIFAKNADASYLNSGEDIYVGDPRLSVYTMQDELSGYKFYIKLDNEELASEKNGNKHSKGIVVIDGTKYHNFRFGYEEGDTAGLVDTYNAEISSISDPSSHLTAGCNGYCRKTDNVNGNGDNQEHFAWTPKHSPTGLRTGVFILRVNFWKDDAKTVKLTTLEQEVLVDEEEYGDQCSYDFVELDFDEGSWTDLEIDGLSIGNYWGVCADITKYDCGTDWKNNKCMDQGTNIKCCSKGSLIIKKGICGTRTYWDECEGTFTYNNGDGYEGYWVAGKKHGQGTMNYIGGDKYEGAWVAGERHGQGTYNWISGSKYEGEWVAGERHGQGTNTWISGAKYEGYWVGHQREGQGIYTYEDGNEYEGAWVEDKRHGQGTMTYTDGTVWTGEWKTGSKYQEYIPPVVQINNDLNSLVTAYKISTDVVKGTLILDILDKLEAITDVNQRAVEVLNIIEVLDENPI